MNNRILIQNTHLFDRDGTFDVLLDGGSIASVRLAGAHAWQATDTIEANGGFLSPGFADVHMHLEKAQTIGEREYPSLMDAILGFKEYVGEHISREDIIERVERTLDGLIRQGTTALRTHISVDDLLNDLAVRTMLEIKDRYRHVLDIQIIAMVSALTMSDNTLRVLDELGATPIDGYGAAPALCDRPESMIDELFRLAERHDKTVDLHADEHDRPDVGVIDYFADRIIAHGMQGRCVAGHLCALSAVSEQKAQETIGKILDSGMHVVTLPSCNLYLMGRSDQGTVRRGTTRIRELDAAGVNVSLASDNIRDPFRPFGNGDMLEEMLLTAQVAQMGTYSDLRRVYRMGTWNPARAMGLEAYGTAEGDRADLVLLEAPSAEEAILGQSNKRFVFKRGRIVCENKRSSSLSFAKEGNDDAE